MTSPSQLKYLDAMGIPVWVSRDLIIEESSNVDAVEEVSSEFESHKGSIQTQTKNNSNPLIQGNGSAQSIIDSLTNESLTNQAQQVVNPSNLGDADNFKNHPSRENNVQGIDVQANDVVTNNAIKSNVTENNVTENNGVNPAERTNLKPEARIPANSTEASNKSFNTPHHNVYTSGSENADWMIIGHSPESFNTVANEPFAGEAGELLNNMLRAVGLNDPRNQAYFANVFDVSDPSAEISGEMDASQRLLKQNIISMVNIVKPKLILLVGQIAAQNLLENSDPLIIMRSKVHQLTEMNVPSIVTYYPSYLLHKPIDKRKVWEDLKLAMKQLN